MTKSELKRILANATPAQRARVRGQFSDAEWARLTEAAPARPAGGTARLTESTRPWEPTAAQRDRIVKVVREDRERKAQGVERMLAGERGGYRSLREAFADIKSISVFDVDPVQVLRESVGYDSAVRSTESATTSTWNTILGDSITRRMVAEYQTAELGLWRQIVSSTPPINDFRTQRVERLGGYGVLPTVGEGAPYQALTSPGNEESTYSLSKKGGTEDLTLETIANDDVRLVAEIPRRLGRAAAQTLHRFVFDFLNANPNIYDSTALFAVGHKNTATATLGRSALDAARAAMRQQTAYGDTSDVLGVTPKFLIVNSNLENIAWEICQSAVAIPTAAPDGGASNIPNIYQGMIPIVVDYWTSPTTWFAVADPKAVPTIEVGFYQGRQDPELIVANDPTVGAGFLADKGVFKIRHIYSGTVLDFRGLYRGNS